MAEGMFTALLAKIIFANKRKAKLKQQLNSRQLPRHVAIIMDGNGRWARKRGLPRTVGHRAGAETLRKVVKVSVELKIEVLTVYAFSTENWKRPREEVNTLMQLLVEYLQKETLELHQHNVQLRIIGGLEALSPEVRTEINKATSLTKANTGLTLNIAINYGGQAEIVRAIQTIVNLVRGKQLEPAEITEHLVQKFLYTADLPDPDLLIRPAGDMRISNFLLWQLAYAEMWFTPTLWPDFREEDYLKALIAFQGRERRFGGLKYGS